MGHKRITVLKKVYWSSGGKEISGKVKQIVGDHVVIISSDVEYIVRKEALSLKPLSKQG